MKLLTITILMTASTFVWSQDGKAKTIKKTFSRETSISMVINSSPQAIWEVLTRASDYPKWNSTVVSIEGNIQEGEKIRLKSTLDPTRTFKLKVKEVVPNQKLVWGDALGRRIYLLEKVNDQKTRFSMNEKIGGLMFPLFAKKIPSFDESFEAFSRDLKKEAESKSK